MFAKPEGTDPLNKLKTFVYPCFKGAIFCGLNDIFIRHQISTVTGAVQRILYYVVPATATSFMFASTVFISTRVRGKDDFINYQIGVLSCLPIIHRWFKLPFPIMAHTAVPFLLAAFFIKIDAQNQKPMADVARPVNNFQYKFFNSPEMIEL